MLQALFQLTVLQNVFGAKNSFPALKPTSLHIVAGVLAKTKDFWNLSRDIIKMFISSTEIDVSAEEDVFRAILTWNGHKESERKNILPSCFVKFDLFMYRVTSYTVISWQMILWMTMKAVWILWRRLCSWLTLKIMVILVLYPESRLRPL